MTRLAPFAALIALALSPVAAAAATEGLSVSMREAQGKALARDLCSNCHQVAPGDAVASTLKQVPPGFVALANRMGMTERYLHDFMLTVHPPFKAGSRMPDPKLREDQASVLAAYIISLKRR